MLREEECRIIAGKIFADAIGIDALIEAKDRLVTTQRIDKNIFIMSFGIFDDIIKEDSNNYADKLLTVDVNMLNGNADIVFADESIALRV